MSEVPTIAPISNKGPSRIASSLREAIELIQRGLGRKPRLERVKAFSFLAGVLSLPVDNLAFSCNYPNDAILYSLQHPLQVNLCLFFFLFFS